MSLLQRALDRAENPDPEPVTQTPAAEKKAVSPDPKAAVKTVPLPSESKHEAPRLNAMRFYETQNQAVEKDIRRMKALSTPKKTAEHSGRNVLVLIAVLLIASLGVIPFILPSSSKSNTASEMPSAAETPQTVIVKEEKPFTSKPVSQTKFTLSGITASGDTVLAVINNQVVGEGDKLREGAIVKSIKDNRVVLEFNGNQIVLNF